MERGRMPVSTADLVSPAMACLRVSILTPPGGQKAEDLQALVAKVINAFLQSRWEWPRQFEQMTPYAFVLTDPRAERMDTRGLKALAEELQLKLFGSEGEGEVSLLLFEGSDVEVHRFARLSVTDIDRMLAGEAMTPPFEGSIDRISAGLAREECFARAEAASDRLAPSAPPPSAADFLDLDDLSFDPPERTPPPRTPAKYEHVYAGLYMTLTQSFVGSLALCRRQRRDKYLYPDLSASEPLPGFAAEAFDEGCVESALAALEQDAAGLLFVPLSFSSLVRPTGRRAYARFLCHLPAEQRDRLGAAIYDTPRAPSYFALSAIRRFLDPFFGELNLQVRDPAFEVEKLAPEIVHSVTLALPADREPAERLAAIRRFMQKKDVYKKKRIWPGVSPVVNRVELDACLGLRTPMIGGAAVAELQPRPVGARGVDAESLPFRA
jgi:hypothetical protein